MAAAVESNQKSTECGVTARRDFPAERGNEYGLARRGALAAANPRRARGVNFRAALPARLTSIKARTAFLRENTRLKRTKYGQHMNFRMLDTLTTIRRPPLVALIFAAALVFA